MSRLAGVYPTISDGNLGIQGVDGTGVRVVVGVSSLGTQNVMRAIGERDEVPSKLGVGTLSKRVADQLTFGGGTVYAVRAAGDVPGAITANPANLAAPAVTTSATSAPLAAFDIVVTITTAGALGVGAFQYSLDGGDTLSEPIALAATYQLPDTGITLEFAVGAYILGATYRFIATEPKASISSLQTAIRAAFAQVATIYEYIHVAQAADAATWAMLEALRLEAYNAGRDVDFIAETVAPGTDIDTWVNARLAEKATFQSVGVYIIATHAEVIDTLTGRLEVQSLAGRIAGRISSLPVHVKASQVDLGALPGVIAVAPFTVDSDGVKRSSYNNAHALALETAGFTTVMQHPGSEAYFVSEDRTAAPTTSDFKIIPNRRVILKINTLLRQAWLQFVQRPANPEDLDASLAAVLAAGRRVLRNMAASSEIVRGTVELLPNQDLISTSKVKLKVRAVPNGYLREIEWDLGLENPLAVEA